MYCVLAEDESDFATLRVLLRRLSNWSGLPVKGKGFSGSGHLLSRGAKFLGLFQQEGCQRFIICYDADRENVANRTKKIVDRIVQPAGLTEQDAERYVVIIPVQAIEAWILADCEHAIPKLFNGWAPAPVGRPETIDDPKVYLESLSRSGGSRPRYSHATHNEHAAKHLRLDVVWRKCPSFRPLVEFVASAGARSSPPQEFPGNAGTEVWVYAWGESHSAHVVRVAQANEWGRFDSYVKEQKPTEVNALLQLCTFGWCRFEEFQDSCKRLRGTRTKGPIKQIIQALKDLKADENFTHIGLDDGTR